jgi:hypothetical protein
VRSSELSFRLGLPPTGRGAPPAGPSIGGIRRTGPGACRVIAISLSGRLRIHYGMIAQHQCPRIPVCPVVLPQDGVVTQVEITGSFSLQKNTPALPTVVVTPEEGQPSYASFFRRPSDGLVCAGGNSAAAAPGRRHESLTLAFCFATKRCINRGPLSCRPAHTKLWIVNLSLLLFCLRPTGTNRLLGDGSQLVRGQFLDLGSWAPLALLQISEATRVLRYLPFSFGRSTKRWRYLDPSLSYS